MIPESLRTYIEQKIIPLYSSFDKAHNLTHVKSVIEESLALAEQLPEVDKRMIYTIAAYHDLGLCKDRKTHHIVSGELLENDSNLSEWFTNKEIQLMKEAVEDHRASSNHEPRSLYGRIVSEADRLIETDSILRRTIQYGLKQAPLSNREWHYERFLQHLNEKYAPGGYLKLYFPHSNNAIRLQELQAIISNKTELRHRFDLLFDEEQR